jgi:hypothetical protein
VQSRSTAYRGGDEGQPMMDISVIDSAYGFSDLLQRAKAEFTEMPGLTLTYDQAVRLWACHPAVCRAVLETLVETRFLVRTRRAAFARNE